MGSVVQNQHSLSFNISGESPPFQGINFCPMLDASVIFVTHANSKLNVNQNLMVPIIRLLHHMFSSSVVRAPAA